MSCGHLCARACSCLSHCMHEQLLALCGHMSRSSAGILQQSLVLNVPLFLQPAMLTCWVGSAKCALQADMKHKQLLGPQEVNA